METSLQLNEGENLVLECRPQKTLIVNLLFKDIMRTIVLIIFVFIYSLFSDKHSASLQQLYNSYFPKALGIFLIFAVVYFGIIYAINAIKVSHFRYILTDQRCIIYSGFIGINKQVIPYNRVADVNIQQGTGEAILGLSSVFIDEQAMNFSNGALLKGLNRDTAEQITKIVSQHSSKKQV